MLRKKKTRDNQGIEDAIGYRFRDPERLQAALTHRSFRFESREPCQDNQRLEFLGDAVLGLIMADWASRHYEEHPEGMLTVLRSRIASAAGLAAVARDIGLGGYLRLGRGEIASGGSDRDSTLADAMEALLAAVYLDGGLKRADAVFRRVFASRLEALDADLWADNPKGRLQQLAQREHQVAPVYTLLGEDGPLHARTFRVEVRVETKQGEPWRSEGTGNSKQSAQVEAAQNLLASVEALAACRT